MNLVVSTTAPQLRQLAQTSPVPSPAQSPKEEPALTSFASDRRQRSPLKAGLIGGVTAAGLTGAITIPLMPHAIVNLAAGAGAFVAGGIAGAVVTQTARTRSQATLHGSGVGALTGFVAAGVGTRSPMLMLGAAALGAIGGAAAGFSAFSFVSK